jgi:hypothetical protein
VNAPPFEITTTRQAGRLPRLNILIHGPSGAGKTYLAKTTGDLERTLVVAAEPGLLTLRDVDIPVVEVTSVKQLQAVHRWLYQEAARWRWVIFDSLSEVAEAALAEARAQTRDGRKAYGDMGDQIVALIKGYRDLPLNVVMLCKQQRIQDESGHISYAPSLPGKRISEQVPYLFDEVFALRAEPGEPGPDGRPVVSRYLQTACDGTYEAKDRSGVLDLWEAPDLAHIERRILEEAGEPEPAPEPAPPPATNGRHPANGERRELHKLWFARLDELQGRRAIPPISDDDRHAIQLHLWERTSLKQLTDEQCSCALGWLRQTADPALIGIIKQTLGVE